MKEKLVAFFDEFGSLAVVVYFSIFGLTLAGFFVAILWGVQAGGVSEGASTFASLVAAYGATKLTQPLRIGATLAVTPPIALLARRRKRLQTAQTETPGAPAPSAVETPQP
jgi:hypothetical protein